MLNPRPPCTPSPTAEHPQNIWAPSFGRNSHAAFLTTRKSRGQGPVLAVKLLHTCSSPPRVLGDARNRPPQTHSTWGCGIRDKAPGEGPGGRGAEPTPT